MEILIKIGSVFILACIGYIVGSMNEKKHYRSIIEREEMLRGIAVVPVRTPPGNYDQRPYRTELVCGSVVIAMDYFKILAGSIKKIFGGNLNSFETLIERARREAVLRMKEEAEQKNAQFVFNMKFATTAIVKKERAKYPGSVEVIAYGTAIIYL